MQQSIQFKTTKTLEATYTYWRIRVLYSIIIGYAAYYLVKQNLSIVALSMQNEFGFDKTQIGTITSVSFIVYACCKSFWGALGDRISARYFMVFGLFMSSIANIFMGMSSSLNAFIFFWAVNAFFLAMGAPPCIRLLTHWFHPKELGTKWGMWNAAQPIGTAIISVLGAHLVMQFDWRAAFYGPAIICLFVCLFLYNRLRDIPESVGLPSIEERYNLPKNDDDSGTPQPLLTVFFERILCNKRVWCVAIANFFFYILRWGLLNWAPTFLQEVKGSTLLGAGYQNFMFDCAAVIGGLLVGYLSDTIYKGRRGPMGVISCLVLAFSVFLLWYISASSVVLNTLILMLIGFFIAGPQILVGVAAADYASKQAASAANGFTGAFGALGGSFSGYGVGLIAQKWGWDYAFLFFCACALLSAFFFALTGRFAAKKD